MARLAKKRWVSAANVLLTTLLLVSPVDAKVVVSDDGMYSLDVDASAEAAARAPVGTVRMMTGPSHETAPPDAANAERIGEAAAELVAASLPRGARVVPSSSKIAWGKNVPVVRTTVSVEGLPADGQTSAREVLTAVGGRSLYITVWSGTHEQAAELARLADQAAKTTDLKPEGRPLRPLNPWPGRILFFFGIGGLILLRVRMKKNAQQKTSTRRS
jgi:hypothetical protein